MPDLDQIKQGEQGERDRRGRFARGRSGNPAGRPRGCRDHVGPYRERAVEFTMPPIRYATDLAGAMAAVADAAAQGAITPREAMQLGHVVDAYVRAVEATEFERRLRVLEAADAASP
jgi:Family of unknown function (DUF5681)